MKTFSAIGLKPQAPKKEEEKEKEKKKKKEKEEKMKDKKKKDSSIQDNVVAQKDRSKPSEEMKKKNKKPERSLSPISEERKISKRKLLKLAKEYFSEDGESAIAVKPMNAAASTSKPATRVSRPIEKGIMIREPPS